MNDTLAGLLQVLALVLLLAVAYVPLGDYMARVFTAEKHWRVEALVYRLVRVDPASGQRFPTYAAGVLGFSFVSIVLLYLLQRLQPLLPLSFGRGAVPPGMAFNNAVSFTTNTNWQSYVPEQVMGDTVQMAGLTVQNVMSAAVGLAVAVALIRGILGDRTERLGNFWVDLTRGAARILLPLSFVAAILLVGVVSCMSLKSGFDVTTVDGTQYTIPLAPARSQEAIKELGTNGGGYLQRQLRPPVREPERAHEPLRDLPAARDPGQPHPDVRDDGRRPPPGPGARGRHGRDLAGVPRRRLGVREPPDRAGRARRGRRDGGQGGALRRARVGPLRGVDDGHLDRRGQLPARQLTPAARARSRCSTCCSGRSRPAGSAPGSTASSSSRSSRSSWPG